MPNQDFSKPVALESVQEFKNLNLAPSDLSDIYNGTRNASEPFTAEGQFLAQYCSNETILCLREHLVKNTAGSMDVKDLREYAVERDKLYRKTGRQELESKLVNVVRTNEYDQQLAAFIERIKKVLGIKSFVRG